MNFVKYLEKLKKRVHTSFIVESLDYLVRQKYVSEQGGYLADAFMAHPVLVLKKGKMQPVKGASDSEIIPLSEDIDEYIAKNVLPYNPLAFADRKKDKVGYEIPFTRLFYKFTAPQSSEDIFVDIKALEEEETTLMKELFGNA